MNRIILRRTLQSALWAGTVAAAWWLGSRSVSPVSAPLPPGQIAGRPGGGAFASPSGNLQSNARATGGGEEEDGSARAASTAGMDRAAFQARMNDIAALPPGPERNSAYHRLIRDWAAVDGEGALAAAATITEPKLRYELRESALRGWASANPAEAWKFAKANPNGDLPDNRIQLVFDGLSRSTPETVFAFYSANREEMEKHGDRAAYVFDELYERGNHSQLVAWAEKLEGGKLKDMAMNRIIDRWARYDPAGAKAWMDQNASTKDNLVPARVELAESWARVDPGSALSWVNSLPADQRDSEYYNRIFGRWIQYDRNAAAQYLASQPPSPALDRSIERYAQEVMWQNPADTMPWAESISDDKRRWRAIERVAEAWGRRDGAGLAGYIASSNLTDAQKAQLMKQVRPKK